MVVIDVAADVIGLNVSSTVNEAARLRCVIEGDANGVEVADVMSMMVVLVLYLMRVVETSGSYRYNYVINEESDES